MVWFKVDDKLHEHRKPRQAGLAAMGVWALAGSWAADNVEQYNGFVPQHVVARFSTSWRSLATKLTDAGLWEPGQLDGEPGWWFHDWKACNPSAAEVITKRNADAERKRRGRERQKSQTESDRTDNVTDNGRPNGVTPGVPAVPTRPDPTRTTYEGGNRTETLHPTPDTNPPDNSERCSRHPNGNPTDEPCAGCARIRARRDERTARETERQRLEAEDAARNCPTCEGTHFVLEGDDKRPTKRKCDHRGKR